MVSEFCHTEVLIMSKLCVGLFGTCGQSRWRDRFVELYQQLRIEYYNPQVPEGTWKSEMAEEEAEHLAEDAIILFPVTGETYATGSLAETGFSILNAIKLDDRRDFIIMIEHDLDEALNDPVARKESTRARALVKQHLKKLRLSNLYVVENLAEMLEVSLTLYEAAKLRFPLQRFNPHSQ